MCTDFALAITENNFRDVVVECSVNEITTLKTLTNISEQVENIEICIL